MRLLLFGPPGIGKGTQSALLTERLALAHVSTGNMLRAAIRAGTPLGEEVRHYIEAGRLVPGPIVRHLADEELLRLGLDDFVLDGYPRTVEQAEWLDALLAPSGVRLDAVVSLVGPDEEIIERLSRRRIHKLTGESYHLDFNPPPADLDPALVVQRVDDRPEAIRKRLQVYRAETQPVEAYYRACGLHYEVDAVGEIEDVYRRILAVLRQAVPAFTAA